MVKNENRKLKEELSDIIFSKNIEISELKDSNESQKRYLDVAQEDNLLLLKKIKFLE